MPWDPRSGTTFGEYLRRKHIHTPPTGGWTYATKDRHSYGERADGVSFRATTDQLGNIVTEHADGRQDVTINLQV